MVTTVIALGLLGLCLGSFVNALVWRVYQQEKLSNKKKTHKKHSPSAELSILKGRSVCPNCRHKLSSGDLVPVISWLALKGRCRYCKKPISMQYPLVELATGAVFGLSYLFWPVELVGGQILLLATWLVVSVGLMALLVYDLKWMLLPNRLIYPSVLIALTGRAAYLVFYQENKLQALTSLILSVVVASGIFWVIFLVSKGTWIGYGDVRLGLVTGTVLASPSLSLLMIFTAAVLGSLAATPGLVSGKKSIMSKIPFGPFLIVATWLVILFGQTVLDWYANFLS